MARSAVRALTVAALLPFALMLVPRQAGAADMINGQRIYGMHCAGCHGPRGISLLPYAPSFARGERLMQPDIALLTSIRNGRNAMPGFMGLLRDQEILDVISYLRTMR